ncbi:hypothetical protein ACFL5V_08280 [Fibrobacterota bacterium]
MSSRDVKFLSVFRWPRLSIILFLLVSSVAVCGYSGPESASPELQTDSLEQKTEPADTNLIYEYVAHPILRVLTWPVETFVVPIFETALYPAFPPLKYMNEAYVLERAIDLISFGEDNHIMVYPTMVIATGTGSLTGFTFRHHAIFGRPSERLIFQYRFFVNGNQKVRARLFLNKFGNTRFRMKFSLMHNRIKNEGIPQPQQSDIERGHYSDTTTGGGAQVSHPLIEKISALARIHYRYHDYGSPPLGFKRVEQDDYFFDFPSNWEQQRGINQKFHDVTWVLGLGRSTVNNSNIPTKGSEIAAQWAYHSTTKNHDYHEWDFILKKYFFLGVEKYAITPKEQRELGPLTFDKIKTTLKYKNLKKQIFKRKVIATQFRLGQSYELEGHNAPVYALKSIGNDTPLRGYGGTPFRDYARAALNIEYRFPVMRLVEGTFFNEYGIVGKSVYSFEPDFLRNSWGFGARMARHDIFLFRTQVGFHGLESDVLKTATVNITVDTVY